MAFTRFKDDPARITKQLQQQTDVGRWYVNVPGPGNQLPFMADPHILAQKWGGNIHQNAVDVQSSLLGLNRKINRDDINQNNFRRQHLYSIPMTYPIHTDFLTTEQSRAIMPAWTARDLQHNNSYILFENPQNNFEVPFDNGVSTRIMEKDNFNRNLQPEPIYDKSYTLPPNVTQKSQRLKKTI